MTGSPRLSSCARAEVEIAATRKSAVSSEDRDPTGEQPGQPEGNTLSRSSTVIKTDTTPHSSPSPQVALADASASGGQVSEAEPTPSAAVDYPPDAPGAVVSAAVEPVAAIDETAPESGVVILGAATEEPPKKRFTLHALVELVHDLAIAVIVCILLITYIVQAFKVQGSSMSPTLVNGERILVNKFVYNFNFSEIERGDIVVFWYPEDPNLSFIKRIVALPGEIVEIREGEVYLDGEAYTELYLADENRDARNLTPREVRPGHYFVLGDNRVGSNDSRSWGFVPKRYIYGQAFLRLWPMGSFGLVR